MEFGLVHILSPALYHLAELPFGEGWRGPRPSGAGLLVAAFSGAPSFAALLVPFMPQAVVGSQATVTLARAGILAPPHHLCALEEVP